MDNHFNSPAQVTALYAAAGAEKAGKPASVLILLGILAGALIAMGSAATNTASYGIQGTWTARTVCGLLFPFGLGMVIATGAELFTGNCLITISLLDGRCSWRGMLRNWSIVYLSNFAGALLVAAGCAWFGQFDYSGGQLALFTMRMAAAKCAIPFQNGVVLGFFCNLLVCLGVVMAMSGRDTASRLMGAFLPVCYFVLCGFEHCVANMYYIAAGLMAKMVPAYAQLAAEAGLDLSGLTVGGFLLGNLLPVTIGNVLGGAGLGGLLWYCYRPKS
ncbi:formate/nitrite transporter family protein [Flintibacter sp. HCN-6482]|uniref:formate/nitrite transporter family protein n=1 Tax=Flintibacter sp. HCN-6482 TaxID=3134672 RepID=UPI0030BD866E